MLSKCSRSLAPAQLMLVKVTLGIPDGCRTGPGHSRLRNWHDTTEHLQIKPWMKNIGVSEQENPFWSVLMTANHTARFLLIYFAHVKNFYWQIQLFPQYLSLRKESANSSRAPPLTPKLCSYSLFSDMECQHEFGLQSCWWRAVWEPPQMENPESQHAEKAISKPGPPSGVRG